MTFVKLDGPIQPFPLISAEQSVEIQTSFYTLMLFFILLIN